MSKEPAYTVRNFYYCDKCGCKWEDLWDCACDDDCPDCGARHFTPYLTEDL